MEVMYRSQWIGHGVIFNESPITQIRCEHTDEEIKRYENENNLKKKTTSELFFKGVQNILKIPYIRNDGKTNPDDLKLDEFEYDGFKTPTLKIPLDNVTLNAKLFINLGYGGICCRKVKNYTSLYVELESKKDIPIGRGYDYFSFLTGLSETFIDTIAKEYRQFTENDILVPFYFKVLGIEIPEEHVLRKALFPVDNEDVMREARRLIKENSEVNTVYNEMLKIHGEIGDEKHHIERIVTINHLDEENKHRTNSVWYIGSIFEDKINWTGMCDITNPEKISKLIGYTELNQLTIFNTLDHHFYFDFASDFGEKVSK